MIIQITQDLITIQKDGFTLTVSTKEYSDKTLNKIVQEFADLVKKYERVI